MTTPGTSRAPLRVAIVGSGPAAFYAAEHLLAIPDLAVRVDMFERLPTPYGLVRAGVAPDHQKIKSVTRIFDRIAADPRVRFYGLVEVGRHLHRADLERHYHQILYATGAQGNRVLDIPGEHLEGYHAATAFVAWYNGHPDFCDRQFDFSGGTAAIVGVGNVATDVARILCTPADDLARTDAADYAVAALRDSRIRRVYLLGRRGPAQAAFTNPEIKELGDRDHVQVDAPLEEVRLDAASRAALERGGSRDVARKVELLERLARRGRENRTYRVTLRFLVSPVELVGDDAGHVRAIRLAKNRLTATAAGTLVARRTSRQEEIAADLVLRAVGYRGVALPEVPFNEPWGVILNDRGRVLDPQTRRPLVGHYVAGWIKRGATGVIGTNKPDANETVSCMQADLRRGLTLGPSEPHPEQLERLVRARQPGFVSLADWHRLDEMERARGRAEGRPRVKFTSVADALAALGRPPTTQA